MLVPFVAERVNGCDPRRASTACNAQCPHGFGFYRPDLGGCAKGACQGANPRLCDRSGFFGHCQKECERAYAEQRGEEPIEPRAPDPTVLQSPCCARPHAPGCRQRPKAACYKNVYVSK